MLMVLFAFHLNALRTVFTHYQKKWMKKIFSALEKCEKLKKTSLVRSDQKHFFGDYGKQVMYTCAGVQVSGNSWEVFNCNTFMEKLPEHHWRVLMGLMQPHEILELKHNKTTLTMPYHRPCYLVGYFSDYC